jgi:hypothetical protein
MGGGCIRFRRVLYGDTARMWIELKYFCNNVTLNDQVYGCRWLLAKDGKLFS